VRKDLSPLVILYCIHSHASRILMDYAFYTCHVKGVALFLKFPQAQAANFLVLHEVATQLFQSLLGAFCLNPNHVRVFRLSSLIATTGHNNCALSLWLSGLWLMSI